MFSAPAEEAGSDVVITEIGGTVGDIESLPFLEAIRQIKSDIGRDNVMYIHVTLIPYLKAAGEVKTKPTQHSVKELRSIGIQPNVIVCRTEHPLSEDMKRKIGLFCDIDGTAVIEARDADTLYEVPLDAPDARPGRYRRRSICKLERARAGYDGMGSSWWSGSKFWKSRRKSPSSANM